MSEQLKIVIVGHVDHGKSTFVGRLLHDTGSLPEGKLEQLQLIAERRGVPFEWANLMDALQSERDQNITIDTAQIWFSTAKRQYVIIDAPGHREFLKNMVTGAGQAQAALLLIDANEGVQEQSRRHGYLLHLLGIRQLVVMVNKMDLVGYSKERFEAVEAEFRAFLATLGVEVRLFIPISARNGDNLSNKSPNTPWYYGPTVLDSLDEFESAPPQEHLPLRFPIQDVYRFDERRILAGRIESGTLKVGDRLLFYPGNKASTVKSIERWQAPVTDRAQAGDSIGVILSEQLFIERGAIAAHEASPPVELDRLRVRIFWMGNQPLALGRGYKLKLTTQEAECEVASIEKVIDASTLAQVESTAVVLQVNRHEVAELTLRCKRPVAFDTHDQIVATGRFVLVDGFEVAGGGIIVEDNYPRQALNQPVSENIYWSDSKVSHVQRARRNRHEGCVIWLTGLSGSGKSTIAVELERELFHSGDQVYVLDGDNVRHGLCADLGFSAEDRKENIRRVGEVAKLFADAGIIVVTAFISPYRADRDRVRSIMEDSPGRFLEVYVNAPLAICEERDPKGLYAKARAHKIADFTGISAPYEEPENAELVLNTDALSVAESVARVVDHLRGRT